MTSAYERVLPVVRPRPLFAGHQAGCPEFGSSDDGQARRTTGA
jgi:hypothetical protein